MFQLCMRVSSNFSSFVVVDRSSVPVGVWPELLKSRDGQSLQMRLCTCVANGQLRGWQPRRRQSGKGRAGSEGYGRSSRLSRARESRTVSLIHEQTSRQDVGWSTTANRTPAGTEGWGGKTERTEGSDGRSGRTSPGPVCATVIYHSHLPLPAARFFYYYYCAACLFVACCLHLGRCVCRDIRCAQVGSTGTVPWAM